VNGALDAAFAGPGDHLARGFAVFHAAQADLAQNLDSCSGEFLEVILDHAVFEDGSTRVDLHSARTKGMKGALGEDGHCFQANDVFGAAGGVHFSGGDHCSDAAVKVAIDPAELILAGRPVPADGVHVAVYEAGGERSALRIDGEGGARDIDVFLFANSRDAIADGDHGVGVEDRTG